MSVCVPTYNGAAYILDCLKSLRAQTFQDFELLVVDDASTDATLEAARRAVGQDARARIYRNSRRLGLVGNWNRCVGLARGQWVKFLFQDDYLEPQCLERMVAQAGAGAELVVCRRSFRFEAGTSARVRGLYRRHLAGHTLAQRFPGRRRVSAAAFARAMLRQPACNFIGEPTAVLIRRSAFARYGGFNPDLVNLCDWELAARVAVNSGLRYIDDVLAVFRVHPGAESAFNRSHRSFQCEVLDELIILHELAHGRAYAPARRAARGSGAPDLKGGLLAAARAAQAASGRYSGETRRALRRIASRYPRLTPALSLPPPLPSLPAVGAHQRYRAAAARLFEEHARLGSLVSR